MAVLVCGRSWANCVSVWAELGQLCQHVGGAGLAYCVEVIIMCF